MGERHSGDGPFRRRRAHPGGTLSAPDHAHGGHYYGGRADEDRADSGFEARLGAALRADGVDTEAERRAVAAFRAARATQTSRTRTRRRDDWRPATPRRARLSLKSTLSVVLVSLTLGGVAFAAIDAASGTDGRPGTSRPAHPPTRTPNRPTAPGTSAGAAGAGSGAPATRPHPPATARDTVAHCRTYERAGDRGGALDSTAWQRLVRAAGGEDEVPVYCAAQVAAAQGKKADNSGNSPKVGQTATTDNSGRNGGNSDRKVPGEK
ncbi:hypothetical protein [Streptomyces sp. NPDC052107]|uniref:hypothetical protein n=1 Tax=Streptomyces sp. NPDC052107 TaxID=3155632 RepID=UPI00343EA4EF